MRSLRFPTFPLAAVILLAAGNVMAALPYYDPFADATGTGGTSYSVGSPLAGQADGTGAIWNSLGANFPGTEPRIAAGNLSYPNLPQSTGSSVQFSPAASMSARLNFNSAAVTSGAAYYSFLLKITDISQVPTNAVNNYFTCFSDGNAAQVQQLARAGSRLLTKKVDTGFVLGIGRNNTTTDYVYDPTVRNVGDVLFVVASYELAGGVTNVNLWVNPASSSFGTDTPPSPTVSAASFANTTGNLNAGGVGGFVILCQSAMAPSGLIDDVRVGTTWSSITGGDPAIIAQPTNKVVSLGANATFSVTARGTPTLTYQWYKDGTTPLFDGGNISGANSGSLTITGVGSGDLGDYSVVVMNGFGSTATSMKAHLALTDPRITTQPEPVTVAFGSNAMFMVVASGTAPFTYLWHKEGFGDLSDGGNISGSHSDKLTISSATTADNGNYYVTVSNAVGVAVDSASAMLTVQDPFFTVQPVSINTNAGAVVSFHVSAVGSGGVTYQWFKDGNFVFDLGNVTGSSSDTLTINGVAAADQGGYYAQAYSGSGNTYSATGMLAVLTPATISIQPSPRTVAAGSKAVFAAGVAGSGPFTYQWQRNGTNLIDGTSGAFYIVTNAQPEAAGNYQIIVSNSVGAVTSSVVALTVSNVVTLAEGNLIVIRVGDGAQTLGINGNSMAIDQYKPDGTYVNTVNVPDDGPGAMVTFGQDNITGVNSGSTTGTCLTRSKDGRFMVIAGYNTNLNYGASLLNSPAATVPRGIGIIDSFGQYTLVTTNTDSVYDQTYWRAAVYDGTNNFWGGAGKNGTYYFGYDAPGSAIQTTFMNLRSMALFNGDIYCAGAVNGFNGVLKISGLPTNGAAATATVLFSGSTGSFDMMVSPDGRIIYLADQRNVGNSGGLQRYDFDGANWNLSYTLNTGFGNLGPRYVTADFSGDHPVVYVTSNDQTFDNDRIIKVDDQGPGSSGVTIAYAGVNQTFRSIRFGPVPNTVIPRPTLVFQYMGGNLVLTWSGAFKLQSAADVNGPYTDVNGATSPYTNSVTSASKMFFRLKK